MPVKKKPIKKELAQSGSCWYMDAFVADDKKEYTTEELLELAEAEKANEAAKKKAEEEEAALSDGSGAPNR